MFTDIRVKHKLFIGFAAIVAIILALLALAYASFERLSRANGLDRHTLEVLREVDKVDAALLEIQSAQRGYALTGDERFRVGEKTVQERLARLRALSNDSPVQQQRLTLLGQQFDSWLGDVVHPVLARRQAADRAGASVPAREFAAMILDGFKHVAAIKATLADIGADEERLLVERARESAQLQQLMRLLLSGGGLLCVALALAIATLLARAILGPLERLLQTLGQLAAGRHDSRFQVRGGDELNTVGGELNRMAQLIQDNQASLRGLLDEVQRAGIQVASSATEIAASARQQEATGIEQAQTSVEVLSTTKEIAANTGALLQTMEQATAVADYTTSATAEAQANLRRMDATMQHMVAATGSINAKLAALSEKASNINGVLTTITKVADQTNILSLNAAIEAEKAGDAGRGFSVVATEIRRLADQTSVSTWDIEQMLKEMQSAVSASVMGMDKFSEEIRGSVGEVRQVTAQLSGVMDQVQKLAPQFDAVLQGMQSQAVGAAQISSTMNQLNDATQQSVESLKATGEAVRQLQYAAGELQASVAKAVVNT